jgi:hypothetical protein
MAWTTPRTWTDGEIPTATILNAQIKANHEFLATHTHTGAAGMGSSSLAPIYVTTTDQGSDPDAPGSSKLVVYSQGGLLKSRAGASGAEKVYSTTDHTHTIQSQATSGGPANNKYASQSNTNATSSYVELVSFSYTPATSASGVGIVGYASGHFASGTSGTTITIQLQIDGSAVATSSGVTMSTSEGSYFWNAIVQFASIGLSASSHTYSLDFKGTTSQIVSVPTGQAGLGLVDFDSG